MKYVMGLTESGREIDRLMARDGIAGIKKRLGGKGGELYHVVVDSLGLRV